MRPLKSGESRQTAEAFNLQKTRLDARSARKQSSSCCQRRNGDIHDASRWLDTMTLNAESLTADRIFLHKTILTGEQPLLLPDFDSCYRSSISGHTGVLPSQSPQQARKPPHFR